MTVRQAKAVRLVVEAMPRLRHFSGTTIVIKYGGAAMVSDHLRDGFANDVVLLTMLGIKPVVVHGGGPEITRFAERLGMQTEFVDGLRVTDAATMEIAAMVLVGKVNREIVGLINSHGGTAAGLSGQDGNLIEAEPMVHVDAGGRPVDLGFVGQVRQMDLRVLELIASHAIPVVASIGASATGQTYNINADVSACNIAEALRARKLVFLSDVPGLLRDPKDEHSVISTLPMAEVDELVAANVITGGMLPKIRSAMTALRAGTQKVHMIDARVPHSLLLEIFTDQGVGTQIVH